MPVVKKPSGHFQAKILSPDGTFIVCKTFLTRLEAEEQLARWKREKKQGKLKAERETPLSPFLDDFFNEWFSDVSSETSAQYQSGWRQFQLQQYRDYVQPVLGRIRLNAISPQLVKRVLNRMATLNRSSRNAKSCLFTDAQNVR